MITFLEAQLIVESKLRRMEEQNGLSRLKIAFDETVTDSFGWVFFYNTEEFMSTGNLSCSLAGNAPLIVDKQDGTLHITGTAEPIDTYIKRYKEYKGI